MINISYRLASPGVFNADFISDDLKQGDIVVRPEYMRIAESDRELFSGKSRYGFTVYPLAPIHNATAKVLFDPENYFKPGEKVVLVPAGYSDMNKENPHGDFQKTKYRAVNRDGFLQNFVIINRSRAVKASELPFEAAVMTESVADSLKLFKRFDAVVQGQKNVLGFFGDTSQSYISAALAKKLYPRSRIVVIGQNAEKLKFFSFADGVYTFDNVPAGFAADHAFVFASGGWDIRPESFTGLIRNSACVGLYGEVNTKLNIEAKLMHQKALTLFSVGQSEKEDFAEAVDFMKRYSLITEYIKNIITRRFSIKSTEDITAAFVRDASNPFATVMKWDI